MLNIKNCNKIPSRVFVSGLANNSQRVLYKLSCLFLANDLSVHRMLKRDLPKLAQPSGYKVDPGEMLDEEIVAALRSAKTIMKGVKLDVLEGRRKKKKKRKFR